MSINYEPLKSIPPEPISDSQPSSNQNLDELDELAAKTHRLKLSPSNVRYLAFMTLGISLLWPWNCLLSLSPHYATKLTVSGSTTLGNGFTSSMMTVSTLTSLIMNSFLTTRQKRANFPHRILLGSAINIAVFVLLSIQELFVTTVDHSWLFFLTLMGLTFASSAGTCLAQNGTMSIVNVMGARYAQGVMVGQAVAGVLPSLALMVSNFFYADTKNLVNPTKETLKLMIRAISFARDNNTVEDSGLAPGVGDGDASSSFGIMIYLILTSLVTLMAAALFYISHRLDDDDAIDFDIVVPDKQHIPFMTLFEKLSFIVLGIFTVFLFTLVFPIFAGSVTSIHDKSRFFSEPIYIPFVFFVWNFGDLMGRIVCSIQSFVITSDSELLIYSILRSLIIPLFFLCNLPSNEGKPIVSSDLFYVVIQFIFGFTNGHCLSCCFMSVAKYVSVNEREAAGGFCNVFLSLGLLAGSLLSYVFVAVV